MTKVNALRDLQFATQKEIGCVVIVPELSERDTVRV